MKKILLLFLIGLSVIKCDEEFDFKQQMIFIYEFINFGRPAYQVEKLTISTDLEKLAKKYSDYLLKHPEVPITEHSGNTYEGTKLGENIYVGKKCIEFFYNSVESWFQEKKIYFKDSKRAKPSPETAHFTQLVWKNSKLIGCGLSCNDDICYLVCDFYPPGNIENEYEENVFDFKYVEEGEEPIKILEDDQKNLVEEEDADSKNALEKFRDEITEIHNYYRKLHGVGEVERDSELEKIAQNSAKEIAEYEGIELKKTTEKYEGNNVCENIFITARDFNGKKVVDEWYSTIKYYNFNKPVSFKPELADRFINVIWKSTKKIGCGYAVNDGYHFATCVYYPCDNCDTLFSENVLPESE